MSLKRITVQDIADELNISRNTVSKALNNTGSLAESTKSKIIEKAIEMGYKQFAYLNNSTDNSQNTNTPKNIALFTSSMPNSSHFGFNLLSGFEKKISDKGYKLSIHMIREPEIINLCLPNNFTLDSVSGIICIEMFNKLYSDFICSFGIPTLFIDSEPILNSPSLKSDILLMENYISTYNITKKLIENNRKNISFVGDINHCQSFHERFRGYRDALLTFNIPTNPNLSILRDDNNPYSDVQWLSSKIDELPVQPDAFVCANDFIAITIIKALKLKGLSVPEDILVCGFDDSSESKI
ncbi:MAG: LacI family DNA-binding transcriptional regulator, partial [Clostridium sp.]|nr:LacI family DNA-binding transcriptional regulator [Clostridium sp.]